MPMPGLDQTNQLLVNWYQNEPKGAEARILDLPLPNTSVLRLIARTAAPVSRSTPRQRLIAIHSVISNCALLRVVLHCGYEATEG